MIAHIRIESGAPGETGADIDSRLGTVHRLLADAKVTRWVNTMRGGLLVVAFLATPRTVKLLRAAGFEVDQ